jgi:hypothetical protein
MSQPIEPISGWDPWWDQWIYGAKNIGIVVDLKERQAYHALENGYLDGEKFGKRKWRSTRRRLLRPKSAPAPALTPGRSVPENDAFATPAEPLPLQATQPAE